MMSNDKEIKIVFLCLGNICRSPMAEFIAKDLILNKSIRNIKISSCGTANYHQGEYMHKGTDKVLSKYKIEHSNFSSNQINKKIFDEADFILVMDESNYQDVINKFGSNKKVRKITDYCSLNYSNVPDPWYTNDFEETFRILNNSIKNFFESELNIEIN